MSRRLARTIIILNLICLVLTLAAGSIAAISFGDAISSRSSARRDTCRLIKGLAYAATSKTPKSRAAASAYINSTPLANCNLYAATDK